jgi:hypothetical protein
VRAAGWAWRVDPGELLVPMPCELSARPSPDMGLVELLAWWRHRHDARPFDWVEECPELRIPPEGHVRLVSRSERRSGTMGGAEDRERGSRDD